MHIAIQRDIDAGVSQNLAQALCVEARFHASRRESMAKRVKIRVRNAAGGEHGFEAVLHRPRLYKFLRVSREQESALLICFA